jgi:hypothetical protein
MSERLEAIRGQLRHVYGKGQMVEALAETIDSKWSGWLAGDGNARHDDGIEYAVQMECWNWFSGGGTAEIAAKRIIAAVAAASPDHTNRRNNDA